MWKFCSIIGCIICLLFSATVVAQPPSMPPLPDGMQRIDVDGIENFIHVSERVYSGGEPTTAGLEQLKAMGVTILVSVDGLAPDRQTAEKLGMRYVHIPMGYDGIESSQLQDFVTLMANHKGKLFVHCHHGKHRGPAAVAACMLISKKLSKDQALQYMRGAGTGKDYKGLWKSIEHLDVTQYQPQDFSKLLAQTRTKDMSQWMAELDRSWEEIQASQKNSDFTFDASHLVVVVEAFKESARCAEMAPAAQFGDAASKERLQQWLKDCEIKASSIQQQIEAGAYEKARAMLKSLGQQCVDCHTEYRN